MLVQETPNPLSVKFMPKRDVWPSDFTPSRTFFVRGDACLESPFAKTVFENPHIQGVFFGSQFITITKLPEGEWSGITAYVTQLIEAYEGKSFFVKPLVINTDAGSKNDYKIDSSIIKQITDLIETRVRPAVAEDGGDITFHSFQDGIVYVNLSGSCVGCPSSSVTLKAGIERMLQYYVPEVKEVKEVSHDHNHTTSLCCS